LKSPVQFLCYSPRFPSPLAPAFSHTHPLPPTPLLQASSKMAALKEENDGLKSQVTLLLQPRQPASMASAASGALDDAEPEFLNDSEEASS
jgi:hypothetical protein